MIELIDEWTSDKESTGRAAKMETAPAMSSRCFCYPAIKI